MTADPFDWLSWAKDIDQRNQARREFIEALDALMAEYTKATDAGIDQLEEHANGEDG